MESISSIPIVGKEATNQQLSNPSLLSIQGFGAMAGRSEVPPSLDSNPWRFLHLRPYMYIIVYEINWEKNEESTCT